MQSVSPRFSRSSSAIRSSIRCPQLPESFAQSWRVGARFLGREASSSAISTRLKQERSGGYLLAHGGTRFARLLVKTGLIDEYRLVIHPFVLGAGERIPCPAHHRADEHTVFSGGGAPPPFPRPPDPAPSGPPGANSPTAPARPTRPS